MITDEQLDEWERLATRARDHAHNLITEDMTPIHARDVLELIAEFRRLRAAQDHTDKSRPKFVEGMIDDAEWCEIVKRAKEVAE